METLPPTAAPTGPLLPAGTAPAIERYHIEDEPRPRGLARFAVQPLWPLFAVMFGGCWLSWPWSVWNGWVIGSPTLGKEIAWAVGGFAGRALLAGAVIVGYSRGLLSSASLPFAVLPITLWTLGVSYALNGLQSRTFQLYEHYGGSVRSGLLVVALGYALRQAVQQSPNAGLFFLFLG
jgi:hypothetical protein